MKFWLDPTSPNGVSILGPIAPVIVGGASSTSSGGVQSVVAGTNVTVDSTDPANPVVSATGGGGGGAVDSVNGQTGTVVLDADDIDDTSTTNRFVTASDLTVLSNTSGTNTGDQDLSGLVAKTTTVNGHALSSNVTVTADDVLPTQTGNSGKFLTTDGSTSSWGSSSGSGDMLASTYDPQNIASDAFGQDNMTDGTTNKNYSAMEQTKLAGIEASADVTDTTNVTAAGAVMDSEVTNLAEVKAFDSTDYATAAQGTTADSAVQPGDLATVATTGAYSDLSGTPSLSGYEVTSNKATDFTTVNNTLYPSVQAVNTAINTAVTGLADYRGNYDASGDTYPTSGGSGLLGAVAKGDYWTISVAGTLGGTAVAVGDMLYALADTPATSAGWNVIEHDLGYAPLNAASNLSDLASASSARTNLGLGTLATQSGTFSGTSSGTNTGDQTSVTGNAGTVTNGVYTTDTGTVTNTMLAGSIANSKLANGAVANLSGTNTGDQTTVSGNAGTATILQTSRTIGTLTGDVTSAGSTFNGSANNTNATVVGKINGVSMAGLATGIVKNTTATGVPSIAVAGTDYTTPSSTETVTNKSISGSTNTLTNVGPSARTGGFFVGAITASTTLNTTGNKSITGVGFTPKLVRFRALFPSSATGQNEASGVMTSASQNYSTSATSVAATTLFARNSSQAACIGYVSAGSATPSFIAEYVSMDADGFTIHVTTANSAVDIEYECYA